MNKEKWEVYLTKYMKAFNELPDLPPLLGSIAPLIFQFIVTDRKEMNYWQFVKEDKINWGLGDYSGPDAPKIIHKTDFNTLKKTLSGESDPIQETMAGTYIVEGDLSKLMACAPLLPLNAKAHENIIQK
ncbi:MAG: hypothetical protein ACFFAN_15690 [Promethearchaeota archaeon]